MIDNNDRPITKKDLDEAVKKVLDNIDYLVSRFREDSRDVTLRDYSKEEIAEFICVDEIDEKSRKISERFDIFKDNASKSQ